MNPLKWITLLYLLSSPVVGCRIASETHHTSKDQQRTRIADDSTIIQGTMRFIEVVGGCWQLETSDNRHYELMGQDLESIYVDGLKVELEVKPVKGVNSICQVGDMVQVLQIMRVFN